MRWTKMCTGVALALVVAAGPVTETANAQTPRSDEPTEFLEGLAGTWEVTSEARLGPGEDPVRLKSREEARLIGGRWLVAESTGHDAGGTAFTSILTLGYDPVEEQFVGTWISGRQAHMWSYVGSLDASRSKLTLETEGPVMGDPERTAQYREVIEAKGPDHKVVRSLILGPDGQWFEFQRAEYRRNEVEDPQGGEDR